MMKTDDRRWEAVAAKDSRFDGQFVFAVSSTKIYCRPSCPSRRPRRERVTFFDLPAAAEQAGFRACLRCEPRRTRVIDSRVELVQRVCRFLDASQTETVKLADLEDNMDLRRLPATQLTPKDVERLERYVRAWNRLTSIVNRAGTPPTIDH